MQSDVSFVSDPFARHGKKARLQIDEAHGARRRYRNPIISLQTFAQYVIRTWTFGVFAPARCSPSWGIGVDWPSWSLRSQAIRWREHKRESGFDGACARGRPTVLQSNHGQGAIMLLAGCAWFCFLPREWKTTHRDLYEVAPSIPFDYPPRRVACDRCPRGPGEARARTR